MRRLLRRALRPIAAVAFVTIATVVSLSCISAADLSAQEQACCRAMDSQCGVTMAREHGCCSSEASDQAFQQVAGAKAFSIEHPVLKLVATLAFIEPHALTSSAPPTLVPESIGSPPGSRGVPLYLALTIIRV